MAPLMQPPPQADFATDQAMAAAAGAASRGSRNGVHVEHDDCAGAGQGRQHYQENDWEKYKPDIHRKYMEQQKTLPTVMKEMMKDFGFHGT